MKRSFGRILRAVILTVVCSALVCVTAPVRPSSAAASQPPLSTGDGNWVWLNPLPQGNSLWDCDFVSPTTGWAVGDDGVVLHTTDGGDTWGYQASLAGPESWIRSATAVAFADPLHGWVGSSGGSLSRTTDGGLTWSPCDVAVSPHDPVYDVCATDAEHVWALGGTAGTILRSTDGGASWARFDPVPPGPNSISFVDAEHGWAAEDEAVLSTTDGGVTWESHPLPSNGNWVDVVFVDHAVGWVGNDSGSIYGTTDGGATWDPRTTEWFYSVTEMAARDATRAWAASYTNLVRRTTTGGLTWETVWLDVAEAQPMLTVDFVDDLNGWTMGYNGAILRSTDAGATWTRQGSGPSIGLNGCTEVGQVMAAAGGTDGAILRSTDWGATWARRTPYRDTWLFSVDRAGGDCMVAVGTNGVLLRSTDDGLRWSQVGGVMDARDQPRAVAFTPSGSGWVVGSGTWMTGNPLLLRSTDRGATWEVQRTVAPSRSWLSSVCVVDDLCGFAGGSAGLVLRTTDGGATWATASVPTRQTIMGIDFIDRSEGWGVGDRGRVFHTTDGGTTWVKQTSGAPGLDAVDFCDANVGFAVGMQGSAVYTTDGGDHWEPYDSGTFGDLTHIEALDSETAIAVGQGGTVLSLRDKLPPSTTVSGADDRWHRRPVTLRLSAADFQSGVATTEYRIDDGAWETGTNVVVAAPLDHTNDGVHTVSCRSTDLAGNVEDPVSVTTRIDTRRPVTKALSGATVRRGGVAVLHYRVADGPPSCGSASVRIRVTTLSGGLLTTLGPRLRPTNADLSWRYECWLPKGRYRFSIFARDVAGNRQSRVGSGTLVVR